jgi:hypothetical protein
MPRRRSERRAGWGLVFSAPKSVSLMTAAEPTLSQAHVAAVNQVLGYLESRLHLKRVDRDGRALPAAGLIAASFDHTTNAGSEPHLHTHVVVANASRSGDRWGAVEPFDWHVERRALAALFELDLRHQLDELGLSPDWRLRPDGLADLADVPRAAVRAASAQGRLAATAGRFVARNAASPQPWETRAAEAGFVAPPPPSPHAPGAAGPSLDDPGLRRAVGLRLTSRRSDFRRADVIETLASCWPGGASVDEATSWADHFCDQNVRVRSPTTQPRWATPASRRLDEELRSEIVERSGRSGGVGAASGVRFMGCDAGRTDLLSQAEVIESARAIWEESGLRVAVSAPDPMAEARWAVLTGLPPWRPGNRADVLVVDRADRRPSADLLRLVRAHQGGLVLVEGGTMPRLSNPASHGLTEAGDLVGRLMSGPHRPWGSAMANEVESGWLVGRRAAETLLSDWRSAGDGSVLVALGIEEIRALNRAAVGDSPRAAARGAERFETGDRVVVVRAGPGLPPFGTLGTVAQRSDDTVTFEWLDGAGRAGGAGASWAGGAGASGAGRAGRQETTTSDRRVLASVDLGYAVSPRVAAGLDLPLRLLGPVKALGPGRERVVASIEVAADRIRRDRGLEPTI